MRDAYDALELAEVLFLIDPKCPLDLSTLRAGLTSLVAFAPRLPTQTYRSEDQIALQQFSTPVPLAWLASTAAALRPSI